MQSAIHLFQFETSERDSFGSVQDSERDSFGSVRYFRAQSASHSVQFGTSVRRARFIRFSSRLQSEERDSFGPVHDFRAQSAIHLVQFGTSECRARII